MEENLNQNIPPVAPVEDVPTPSVNQPPFGSWWKVGVLGAVILTGGIFFAGYQYSQKQTRPAPSPPILNSPPITSTPVVSPPSGVWQSEEYRIMVRYPANFKVIGAEQSLLQLRDDETWISVTLQVWNKHAGQPTSLLQYATDFVIEDRKITGHDRKVGLIKTSNGIETVLATMADNWRPWVFMETADRKAWIFIEATSDNFLLRQILEGIEFTLPH